MNRLTIVVIIVLLLFLLTAYNDVVIAGNNSNWQDNVILQVSSGQTISVSSSAWTLAPNFNFINRDGLFIVNPSTNSVNFRGVVSTSSILPLEARDVFSLEISPMLNATTTSYFYNFNMLLSDSLYLWFTSTGTNQTQNINIQQYRKRDYIPR